MIQRKAICEFFGLYPWNSVDVELDFDDKVLSEIHRRVSTDLIFTEVGRRFYEYTRGRNDVLCEPTEDNRFPDYDKDPEGVTEWVMSEFSPKDILQFYVTLKLPELMASLVINTLLDSEATKENIDASKEILEKESRFYDEVWVEFLKNPNSEKLIEKYGLKRKNLENLL